MNIQIHIMVGERTAQDYGESRWSFDTKVRTSLVSYLNDPAGAAKEALELAKADLAQMLGLNDDAAMASGTHDPDAMQKVVEGKADIRDYIWTIK